MRNRKIASLHHPPQRARASQTLSSTPVDFGFVAFGLLETWLRRRAHRIKPATDVYLGVGFTAVMPGSGRVGSFRIPPVHGKIGISTSDHEPVDRIGGNESTDLTPEFLLRCHSLGPIYQRLVTHTRDGSLSPTRCQNREFSDLFPIHGTTQMGGVIHHPKLGNDFAEQLSMTKKVEPPNSQKPQ